MLQQVASTALDAGNLALVVLGVAIAFRIVRFPDLSGDGSYILGAFISALSCGSSFPGRGWIALLAALAGGAAAGALCSILHRWVRIPNLLAGILVALGLYSVSIRLLSAPNRAVPPEVGVFSSFFRNAPLERDLGIAAVTWATVAVVSTALVIIGRTRSGLRFRAACSNPVAAQRMGFAPARARMWGLALANALVALGGAVFSQRSGFVDVRMGAGLVVTGLAALLLGEAVLGRRHNLLSIMLTATLGAILYRSIVAIALRLGLNPFDINLVTVAIVIAALAVAGGRVGIPSDVPV